MNWYKISKLNPTKISPEGIPYTLIPKTDTNDTFWKKNIPYDPDDAYGYCPICDAPGVVRDRCCHPGCCTSCINGHRYDSKYSVYKKHRPGENRKGNK